MRIRFHKKPTLLPYDAEAFSPFVFDPVGQLLLKIYRGETPPPFGRLLQTAHELWDGIERDPVCWEALNDLLTAMRAEWGSEMKVRAIGKKRTRGVAPSVHARTWQRGGIDPETGDRYYLRIPRTAVMGTRLVGKILGADIGFPVVSLAQVSGKSNPVYLLGDATELLEEAAERRWRSKERRRGRPPSLWAIAREIEREGTP